MSDYPSPSTHDPFDLPLVVATGDSSAQGAAIGEVTRERIQTALGIYKRRFRDERGLTDDDQRRLGAEYGEIVSRFSPRTGAMLNAMSDAAGVAREDVLMLNARSEVLYGSSTPSETDGACTTGAVLNTHTADAATYLLQNWDWRYNLRDQIYLLATEDPDGHQILTLAEAGMTAKAGINSSGIAVGLNLLASDQNKSSPGVPVHIMLREILLQRRLSSAITVALQADREGSANLIMASHEGDAIDLELVADDFTHHLPTNGIITHANHFQRRGDWKDLYVDRAAFTLLRDRRLRDQLEQHGSNLSVEDMQRALSDHASHPDGVCRHVDTEVAPNLQISTLCSMVMNTSTRSVHVAPLNPCQGKFRELRLADIFTDTNA